MWTICGEDVVLVWIFAGGKRRRQDLGSMCIVEQFGVTEVAETRLYGQSDNYFRFARDSGGAR